MDSGLATLSRPGMTSSLLGMNPRPAQAFRALTWRQQRACLARQNEAHIGWRRAAYRGCWRGRAGLAVGAIASRAALRALYQAVHPSYAMVIQSMTGMKESPRPSASTRQEHGLTTVFRTPAIM